MVPRLNRDRGRERVRRTWCRERLDSRCTRDVLVRADVFRSWWLRSSAADYYTVEIGEFLFCNGESGDEVFVAFEAGGLAEKALGRVHVADHTN